MTLNAAKFFIHFGRIKRHPKDWWSAEVDEAVSEKRKAFAASYRSDEDRQAYISVSRHASSVIAKAKAEAWQTTCSYRLQSRRSNDYTIALERLYLAASRAISGCLLSFSIRLLLSEVSLPPLRITLTHFVLSSYEWALRLPTSFLVLDFVKLGVKSRLCRSSWRDFVSTHFLMLPSIHLKEALLSCLSLPSWNLPSFIVESILSFPCSRFDRALSRQSATLAYLHSPSPYDLVL